MTFDDDWDLDLWPRPADVEAAHLKDERLDDVLEHDPLEFAVDDDGNVQFPAGVTISGDEGTITLQPVPTPAPAAPTVETFVEGGQVYASVSWFLDPEEYGADTVVGFEVLALATGASVTESYPTPTGSPTKIGPLQGGTGYTVWLVGWDRLGERSVASAVAVVTTPAAPVPPKTDGVPPGSSPTPAVVGGAGFLHARWSAVANADPVTYDVHVSVVDGFTPGPSTLYGSASATSVFIKSAAGGAGLVYGTTYYVKVIARDADGAAAASAQGSASMARFGSDDLADNAVIAAKVAAGVLSFRELMVGSFDNLIFNPGAESGSVTPWTGGPTVDTAAPRSGTYHLARTTASGAAAAVVANGTNIDYTQHPAAAEGDRHYFEAWVRSSVATDRQCRARILYRNRAGTLLTTFNGTLTSPTTTYQRLSILGTAPPGTAYVTFDVLIGSTPGVDAITLYVDDTYARRMVEGNILVDGTVEAKNMKAGTLTATSGIIASLFADVIQGGSFQGQKFTVRAGGVIQGGNENTTAGQANYWQQDSAGLRFYKGGNYTPGTFDANGLPLTYPAYAGGTLLFSANAATGDLSINNVTASGSFDSRSDGEGILLSRSTFPGLYMYDKYGLTSQLLGSLVGTSDQDPSGAVVELRGPQASSGRAAVKLYGPSIHNGSGGNWLELVADRIFIGQNGTGMKARTRVTLTATVPAVAAGGVAEWVFPQAGMADADEFSFIRGIGGLPHLLVNSCACETGQVRVYVKNTGTTNIASASRSIVGWWEDLT